MSGSLAREAEPVCHLLSLTQRQRFGLGGGGRQPPGGGAGGEAGGGAGQAFALVDVKTANIQPPSKEYSGLLAHPGKVTNKRNDDF